MKKINLQWYTQSFELSKRLGQPYLDQMEKSMLVRVCGYEVLPYQAWTPLQPHRSFFVQLSNEKVTKSKLNFT